MSELNRMIDLLALQPHPEGGFYREMHRSTTSIKDASTLADKCAYTTIYYLLSGEDFSAWHRIKSDETWFYHLGCDLLVYYFDEKHSLQTIQVGMESMNLQATIPANTWFAATPSKKNSFSLVSCAVAPGFQFSEFEIGTLEKLLAIYGSTDQNLKAIQALTRA
ncbi:MAG: cupin domain-containing protein [Burkholderiaceae bacterium]|nr:cupin domain-containing protein [Burkholderiaceae bacterium]